MSDDIRVMISKMRETCMPSKYPDTMEQLLVALENCIGICKQCGGTYPHRDGEGRMLDCCGIVEHLNE